MEGKSYKPFNTLKELRAPISGAFLLPMIWRKACMNGQTNSVVEAAASTAAATATKFTYGYVLGGSLIGVIGKIDWAVVFSILIGIATYLTNLYFKKRDEKRKDEIYALQTKQYELTKKRLKGDGDE